jgi:hypothetical protein
MKDEGGGMKEGLFNLDHTLSSLIAAALRPFILSSGE